MAQAIDKKNQTLAFYRAILGEGNQSNNDGSGLGFLAIVNENLFKAHNATVNN